MCVIERQSSLDAKMTSLYSILISICKFLACSSLQVIDQGYISKLCMNFICNITCIYSITVIFVCLSLKFSRCVIDLYSIHGCLCYSAWTFVISYLDVQQVGVQVEAENLTLQNLNPNLKAMLRGQVSTDIRLIKYGR